MPRGSGAGSRRVAPTRRFRSQRRNRRTGLDGRARYLALHPCRYRAVIRHLWRRRRTGADDRFVVPRLVDPLGTPPGRGAGSETRRLFYCRPALAALDVESEVEEE